MTLQEISTPVTPTPQSHRTGLEGREKPVIAVVEPDDAVRASIRDLMELLELEGRCFATARAFLDELGPDSVDALLIELALPGEDAIAHIAAWRESHPRIQILALATLGSEAAVAEALEAGVDDVFEKPHLGAPLARKLVHLFRVDSDDAPEERS